MNEYIMKLSSEKKQEKIILLRGWISIISDIRLQTPKDYRILSQLIFQKTHSNISISTLKSVMEYLPDYGTSASITTLDILSKYVGFKGFLDFVNHTDNNSDTKESGMSNDTNVKLKIRSIQSELSDILKRLDDLEGLL